MKTFKQIITAIAVIKTIEDLNNVERDIKRSFENEKITYKDYETAVKLIGFTRVANNLSDESYL